MRCRRASSIRQRPLRPVRFRSRSRILLSIRIQSARETPQNSPGLLRFLVFRMSAAEPAVLPEAEFLRSRPLVFRRRIVATFTFGTGQSNEGSHDDSPSDVDYSMISVITPAPTVRPPSRMANRSSFSRATGVIRCTSVLMLSPGITISTPSGRVMTPVTSVVRK